MMRNYVANRPPVLAALLRRRAQAAAAGLSELEAMLRRQIRDSLPLQSGSADGDRYPCQAHRAPDVGLATRRAMFSTMEGLERHWGKLASVAPRAAASAPIPAAAERARSLALFSA
ncbi:MAG: hypothetical protein C0499_02220 [Zymomonas sp.]|nr:hypothetical protein [Zymomonas sp.]MBA4040511.1 hypothetical protein [Sphingobium sp.]